MVSPTGGGRQGELAGGGGGQDRTVARRQLVQSPEENRTGSVAGEDLRELTLLLRICVE